MKRTIMLTLITLSIVVVLVVSCTQPSNQVTKAKQMAEEKAVWRVVEKFNASIADESWEAFKSLITEDCIIYGTDITNVDQGYAELEPHMNLTFDMVENSQIIDFRDKSIRLRGDLASAMLNVTWNTTMNGQEVSMPLRWAFTLEKKNGGWLVSQCSASMPTVGQE